MIVSRKMTEEKTIRLNCYSDFYLAATLYHNNFSGTTYKTFLSHGEKLLKELRDQKLVDKCNLLKDELSKSKNYDKYLAEDILMIGTLVRK